jgi:peptide/nickel transport system permease protein
MAVPAEGLPAPRPPVGRRRTSPSLVAGAVLVGSVAATALVSFAWTPYDPVQVDAAARLLGPSADHLLGTDRFGRDTLSQLMLGARTTLFVGSLSVGLAALVGVPVGVLAAMAGGWVDSLLMRANDLLLAFPALLLAIMLAAVFGGGTLTATGRHRDRHGAGLRAGDPQRSAAGAEHRVRPGRPRRRPQPAGHRLAARAAQRRRDARGAGVGVLCDRGAGRGRAELPRLRHPAADAVLGPHAAGVAGVPVRDAAPGPRAGLAIAVAVLGFNLLGDGLRDRFDPRLEGR